MATKVFMEALSPTMEEGKVVSWEKQEGDEVKAGDILAEVETDKAVMELQARGDGVLRKVFANEGTTVEVGKLVAIIAGPDEDIQELLAEAGNGKKGEGTAKAERVAGFEAAVAEPPAAAPLPAALSPLLRPRAEGRIKASPLARRIAAERGIDLTVVRGSGPAGRIIQRDVEAAEPAARPAEVFPEEGYEDVQLSQMRKVIAKRLVESLSPVPHFFLTTEIDMERCADARAALNALDEEPRISFNDIIVKVVAAALRQHRDCNAWWQGDHIRYFNEVHLGDRRGTHHAGDPSRTPEVASRDCWGSSRACRAGAGTEAPTAGVHRRHVLGLMLDIDQFTAVINPPEAGILAIGSIIEKPVVLDGEVVVRKHMRVTMSCDHRVIDGATGARFLQTVRRMLENPLAIVW
jgi:pyruvate dehydrogenase E2 component (dihydrolipoamide acetyltransferase)